MTGYPWHSGDQLLAADLNAAFANGAGLAGGPFLPLIGGTVGPLTTAAHLTGTTQASNLAVNMTAVGSGVNGPTTTQIGVNVNAYKDNYLTTSQVGEIDGLYVTARQGGPGSDVGGILVDVGNTGNGFSAIIEGVSTQMAPSTGATQRAIRTQLGVINPQTSQYIGVVLQAQNATSSQAILINDISGQGQWTNFIEGWRSGSQNFVVNGAGNVSANGGFFSGAGCVQVQASGATTTAGSYVQWNRSGDGSTWIVNNIGGGGTGGVRLGSSDSSGTITEMLTAIATGGAKGIWFGSGIPVNFATAAPIMLPTDLVNAANDAAAGAAGVAVHQMYRNGSQLMVRVA